MRRNVVETRAAIKAGIEAAATPCRASGRARAFANFLEKSRYFNA
jgi:hypothetical protein